ncbi:MAG: hypothetical protein ACRD5E_04270 [Nitrososphaeraceae archaeon]
MSLPDDAVAAESPNAAACAFDSNRASPVASLFTLGISVASERGGVYSSYLEVACEARRII